MRHGGEALCIVPDFAVSIMSINANERETYELEVTQEVERERVRLVSV